MCVCHYYQVVWIAQSSLSLSLSVPIIYNSQQIFSTASNVCTELMYVNRCWSANTRTSIRKRRLWDRLYFCSSNPHVLFILLGWFVRWEVSGRSAAVLGVLLPGSFFKTTRYVVFIIFFIHVFCQHPFKTTVWNWVPGSSFLNNFEFSFTWLLALNALPLLGLNYKAGLADMLDCDSSAVV